MTFSLPFELPERWEIKTVGELIKDGVLEKPFDGNHGGAHPKASDYVDKGIPFIMASDLADGRINLKNCKFISEKKALGLRKGFSKIGDVLISHKATIGRTAIVQENEHAFIMLTPQVTYYRVKNNLKLINIYLKAYFDSRFFQQILGSWAGAGSIRSYLGITDQLKLPVIVPPITDQILIASQANTFDKKLELNRQTNQTLEQIAQAIFKSWFVDFDPVKAKIAALESGSKQEAAELAAMSVISGKDETQLAQLKIQDADAYQQLAQTAALFPAAMQESELGDIPEGWDIKTLKCATSEIRRGISPKYIENEGITVINQKCIRNHTIDFSYARLHNPLERKIDGRELRIGDIVVNSTGVGTLGRLAPVRYLSNVTVFDSHVSVIRADKTKVLPAFLAGVLFINEKFIESSGAGSTGQTELNKHILENIKFVEPNFSLIKAFQILVEPFDLQIAELEKQQIHLNELRDSLLPKLLSGEIIISNFENSQKELAE